MQSPSNSDMVFPQLPWAFILLRIFGNFGRIGSQDSVETPFICGFSISVNTKYKSLFVHCYNVSQRRYRSSAKVLAPVVT